MSTKNVLNQIKGQPYISPISVRDTKGMFSVFNFFQNQLVQLLGRAPCLDVRYTIAQGMKETWNMGITYSGKMYPCLEIFLLCNSVSFSKARRNRVSFFYLRKMKTSPGQAFVSDSFRLLYKSSFFPISRIDHFPFGILLPYILQRYIKCDLNDHGFRHSQVFLSIKYVIQEVLQLDLIILNK